MLGGGGGCGHGRDARSGDDIHQGRRGCPQEGGEERRQHSLGEERSGGVHGREASSDVGVHGRKARSNASNQGE